MFSRDIAVYVTVFMEFVVFGMLFIVVYVLIKMLVVDNMAKINRSLAKITSGNLDTVIDVRTNEEFASLSDDINSTVLTLKRYIAEAAARIDRELEFAKSIQHSAIPTVFPPYPGHSEFDIFASMDTAKEVGGDFYDFYFVGENKFGFLIADVSGKGIPAAMFMMTAKTIIKGYAESGIPVDEVFTTANAKLCESNDAGMFVTAWMGVLDITTGKVEFANAGHNPPLVRHADGTFEYLRTKPGFVLAGIEGVKYRKIVLLIGVCVWGVFGRLDTTLQTGGICKDGQLVFYISEQDFKKIGADTLVSVEGKEFALSEISESPVKLDESYDPYLIHLMGLSEGDWVYAAKADTAEVKDGTCSVEVILERVKPIDFVRN